MRAIEFAGPPMAKRHKTNFTHKDSLPQQAFLFDSGDVKILPAVRTFCAFRPKEVFKEPVRRLFVAEVGPILNAHLTKSP